jgi:uncharacterized protein YlxW (UPF0749 family)
MNKPSGNLWSAGVFVACLALGVLVVSTAHTAGGSDLRPAGGDISSVLADRSRTAAERQSEVADLQRQVDRLTGGIDSEELEASSHLIAKVSPAAGLTEVKGPGVRVELSDAPRSSDASGVDPNLLVVHQQDIQAFVNAMWAGGAQALTLQGRRIVSTTGIKCVGNTVVLDGIPYSPPYVIEGVGDAFALTTALDASTEVSTYEDYADAYGLGLKRTIHTSITAPAYEGVVAMNHAAVVK